MSDPEALKKALEQKAKTLCELAWNCSICMHGKSCEKKEKNETWVSLEDLKDFVVVSRKQLSELFQDFPMPSRIKYYESSYTGTPVFMTERWDKDFFKWEKKVFGEAFSKKGSLLEASETKDPCECPGCHQDFSSCICNEETRK